MANERERSYSDQEFALILNKAAELAVSTDVSRRRRTGLTLEEIKAIATEAGFEPELIERAARQVSFSPNDSLVERAIGGPLKHELIAQFDERLTDERAAHLLAIVRAAVDHQGEGDSTSAGISWNSVGEGSQLFVTAHSEDERTRVRVAANRRDALVITGALSLTAGVLVPSVITNILDFESVAINAAVFAGGFGASLAAARAFWAVSTEQIRERTGAIMDKLSEALAQSSQSERNAGHVQPPE